MLRFDDLEIVEKSAGHIALGDLFRGCEQSDMRTSPARQRVAACRCKVAHGGSIAQERVEGPAAGDVMVVVVHWREVLADWSAPSRAELPPGVPTVLAEFFAAGGRRISSQNTFRDPLDDDGWQVFYLEAQGVCRWAYRGDDHDPEIHVREDGPYRPVGCRLDAFLSAATVLEAVMGAPAWRAAEGPEDESDALVGLPRLDLPHLGWPEEPVRYYGAGDVLAYAQAGFVFIGAHDDAALHDIDVRITQDPRWSLNARTEQA